MLQLIVRYALFAVVATLVNLLTQRTLLAVWSDGWGFSLAMLTGTATGLLTKYALDKRWIFLDNAAGRGVESRKFGLYTLTGVVTTLIFWGTETAFWLTWNTNQARELGAVIGLTIGYWVKYNLDRRFVFPSRKVEV
ncbi:GtrA family protein [Aliirhizobium smilacinae]|jgi:putative flippase GtrA|uniref:GtrA family protein n=1 Tax=Aliirhizobium smilacinae TaxID=1395944 RepID=A0A5C4XJL6_9HYPH|nr:GtrA family protein [Rhizobium smilacinae]TNM63602.1 GtrA family protein [Rhizobium smilacinae]